MSRALLIALLAAGALRTQVRAQVLPHEVATPPTSLPADLHSVVDSVHGVPLDFLGVAFRSDVSSPRKAEILNSVGALSVAGGAPHDVFDGYYLIRFAPSDNVDQLAETARRLNAAEEVVGAVFATRVEASTVHRPAWVPSEPPDSVPASVEALFGSDDVFLMIFEPGLTPTEKSAILDAVGASGTLGGTPLAPMSPPLFDGIYLVPLGRPSGFWDLSLALALLWEVPGALTAGSIVELVTN
jgi:hypothetical protein